MPHLISVLAYYRHVVQTSRPSPPPPLPPSPPPVHQLPVISGLWLVAPIWHSAPISLTLSYWLLKIVSRGRILGRNPNKSLQSFPPCYSQSPLQLCLEISILKTHAASYNFYSSVTVHCKWERWKTWKPYSLPYGLRNSYRNLKSENTQDYAQKPQRNWTFMNSAKIRCKHTFVIVPRRLFIPALQ